MNNNYDNNEENNNEIINNEESGKDLEDKSTNKVKSNRVLPYLLLFVILLILNIILASNINFSGLFNPGGSNGITDINKKIERIGEILEKRSKEEKDEKMDEKEDEIVDDGEDEEITTDDGETETGDDDKNEEENNVTDIEEGDDDKTDDDETETVDDESETAHDEEKIITPEGFIITDIGSINEVKTKNPPDKWMLQTGNNKIPLYEEKFENGLKAMTISDEKEDEYIITVSSSVFNNLKKDGAVEDDDGYLKAQAVKKDGTFFTNNENIDHLKIEKGNFSMIGTQIKMGGNIRIFFTGKDIRNQQVIKLGIFKGQVIIYYDDSKK
jgi:hypothetical protein